MIGATVTTPSILIVGPHIKQTDPLKAPLATLGVRVHVEHDLHNAETYVQKETPQLIVTDLDWENQHSYDSYESFGGRLCGLVFGEKVRELHPNIPIIFYAENEWDRVIEWCHRCRRAVFLHRDYTNVKDLKTVARQFIETPHNGLDVFISHSHQDPVLATAMYSLLMIAMDGDELRVWCSSIPRMGIPTGANVEAVIKMNLKQARVVIGIVTPNSMKSVYVTMEIGARWGMGKALYPLVARGKVNQLLAGPIGGRKAVNCRDRGSLIEMLSDLAEELGRNLKHEMAFNTELQQVVQAAT